MPHQYIEQLISNNQNWVNEQLEIDSEYFSRAAKGQEPQVLWVGCSDSRVDPNELTKTGKGELFVHRNIANLVVYTDMNFLSVLQYAVEVLKVKHIIVCGHYECGGVKAAMHNKQYGLIDNWIQPIKDTYRFYQSELQDLDEDTRFDRMVELNVLEQVSHLGNINIVRNQWENTELPNLHGWVYDISKGSINVLATMINTEAELKKVCKIERIKSMLKA
jgi:carbonic anhydrase